MPVINERKTKSKGHRLLSLRSWGVLTQMRMIVNITPAHIANVENRGLPRANQKATTGNAKRAILVNQTLGVELVKKGGIRPCSMATR